MTSSPTWAVAGRELRAYFLSPGGYIIIALFALVTGGVFSLSILTPGEVASIGGVLGLGTWMLTFVAPAVTMRLMAEEYRLGTIESLITSPLSAFEIVLGKYVGALLFLIAMLVPTFAMVGLMELYARPDYGEVACGYLGLVLAGAAYLATGLFASTLTASQPVVFLMALFFWLTIGLATKLLPGHLDDRWSSVVFAIDPDLRLRDFSAGLLDTSNVVYFASIAVVFLAAAIASVKARRWQ